MVSTIALIICILLLICLIYYHLKSKKPLINYDDNIYEKMVSLRFYFMLVFLIIILIVLHVKEYTR